MTLIKWQPFNTLAPRRRRSSLWDMPALFEPAFESFWSGKSFVPAIDVYEENGKIRLKAEIPGLSEKDVSLEVKENTLTISGEKKEEHQTEKDGYHYSERSFGSFQRTFRLPQGTDLSSINAQFKDGVLDIEIPQPPEQKAKKITIKS
ncbi:Hsp20/alpha crystallin family protein [candidate division CSSED10-310 bacterium]|uniref:Hsp20/alpha crystallin family protein n=1 Tax=candidate division CSSED10-310 bacterium TaxID=2855610 RepID=A0ABV6YRK5_UNCC1